MKKFLLLVLLLGSIMARANVILVKNTANSGTGTLREAVEILAVSGDTIQIDVKGDILLNTPITFTGFTSLILIGPSAKHCKIRNNSGFSGSTLFQVTNCTGMKFSDFAFVKNTAANVRAVTATSGSSGSIAFERMLFKDFALTGSNNGAALHLTGLVIQINACSFIANSADKGGAISINTSTATINNSTFSGNYAVNQGGAIYVQSSSTVNLNHNTFVQNDSPAAPTTYLAATSANQTYMQGNAISGNGTGTQFTGSAGTMNSNGGNILDQNSAGDLINWFPAPGVGDVSSIGMNFNLRPSILEDGYGLMYYPIIGPSPLIDAGQPTTLLVDCRNAPRTLKSASGSALKPDAGACEYTELRVLNTSDNPVVPNSLPWALASLQNYNATNYIEFDILSAPIISPTAALILNGNYIIDGFSQPNSAVPGPGLNGSSDVTKAILPIEIDNNTAVTDGFSVGAGSTNSRISGVRIIGFIGQGVFAGGNNTVVEGCEIGITSTGNGQENGGSGVFISGDNCTIGGNYHYNRNVITGNATISGVQSNVYINLGADNTKILKNIIGLRPDGTDLILEANAVYGIQDLGTNSIIGAPNAGNVISGANQAGIICVGCQNMLVRSNTIGMAYDGMTSRSNLIGIYLYGNGSNATIGGTNTLHRNLISGNNDYQIKIAAFSGANIIGNFIGPNKTGDAASATSDYGIYFEDVLSNNIVIGGSTPTHRNIISGNQFGIYYMNVGTNCQVINNYIGLNYDGDAALPNTVCGIIFQPGVTNTAQIGSAGKGNVISGHTLSFGSGINVSGNVAQNIKGNIIGLDATGTTAIANHIGIALNATTGVVIGGDYVAGEGNTISGNILTGVLVDNSCTGTLIRGNKIGTNPAGTSAIANGSYGIEVRTATGTQIGGSSVFRNIISGHATSTMCGILLKNNGTGTVVSGNLIGSNATGNAGIPNYNGITITDAHLATIGGASGSENYIVASSNAGVLENSTANCVIDGNFIGLGVAAASPDLQNVYGVHVTAQNATIGQSNITVISNNSSHGIYVEGSLSTGVQINNTIIGTNVASDPNLGNNGDGIRIFDADGVQIGTTTGNKIIGNTGGGIRVTGTALESTGTIIQKNIISNPAGTGLTNQIGIYLATGSSSTLIGGAYGTLTNTIGNSVEEGILIENSADNSVYGNKIGNNGTAAFANGTGIRVFNSTNTIIGDQSGQYNVISGNTGAGIVLDNTSMTFVRANLIGVTQAGNVALPNNNGIQVTGSCPGTTIGGAGSFALGNTISGNNVNGVLIQTSGIAVLHNYIGTSQGGTLAVTGQDYGVVLDAGATGCYIGGDLPTEGNVIASNTIAGILVQEANNEIYGNTIGTNTSYGAVGSQPIGIELSTANANTTQIGKVPSGGLDFGNIIMNHSTAGVRIHDAAHDNMLTANYIGMSSTNVVSASQAVGVQLLDDSGIDNKIGNDVSGGGNFISGNSTGIQLDGAVHTFIYNNRIGTTVNGLTAVSNINHGIHLLNAGYNTIGGSGMKSNLISGNTVNGIILEGSNATQNVISGNVIGLNVSQTAVLPNSIGIRITDGATVNFIGQTGAGNGNIIAGNSAAGITIQASPSNTIINNSIGVLFANANGLVIQNGSTGNIVGGAAAERNIISKNVNAGIAVNSASTNYISGNYIGTNAAGNVPLPNGIGIYLNGSDFNEIGNSSHFNLISSNAAAGILIENSPSNTVQNNYIGTDMTGNATFAGSANGVGIMIKNSTQNIIGGDSNADEENVICNNANQGIYLQNADQNEIYGNHIGISKSGTTYLPNTGAGIWLREGSDNNQIGATTTGHTNAVGGNGKGIYISNSDGNQVSTNYVGNNLNGTAVLSGTNNQQIGIHLDSTAASNIISEANVISGNLQTGVKISGKNTKNNIVRGNYIGVAVGGNTNLANTASNVLIADSAKFNIIGGTTAADRNYIGGNAVAQVIIDNRADTNQVAGNYIGLGQNGTTTYTSQTGVLISANSKFNIIGGGVAGAGNTLVGFSQDGIRINDAHNTSILGNRIGIKPDNSVGSIGNAGVKLEGADYNWMGAYIPGSDSMNVITNCNTGVELISIPGFPWANSSYGNVIGGNAIYNNTEQGIDLLGDDLVMPNDTNNANATIDNGGIDRPEIVSAWNCSNGNTWVGFKFYASNALPNYHIEFYRNPTPDPSGYGEGEIYLGDYVFSPTTNYDTIAIDLGQTFPVGTVITATVTGVLGNTSEFSEQYTISLSPVLAAPVTQDESCLSADNGTVEWAATGAYAFSYDGGTSWIHMADVYQDTLPTASYTIDAKYMNGCIQSQSIILNPGLPLPFDVVITPDTCDLAMGEVLIDTVSTNAGGGSGSYIYTFNGGTYYSSAIDSVGIDGGTFNIGLLDNVFGCASDITAFIIPEITEVEDESFVFADFCYYDTPVPASVATPGGIFSFEFSLGDGATIDDTTGLITAPVIGNSYNVIYSVGICAEKDTIVVTANPQDIATFTMDNFCFGSPQNIVVTGLLGGTFSFDPAPTDGATIDASTGEISGIAGSSYTVEYLTNGSCPDSSTVIVNILLLPAGPAIMASDSIYCPGDVLADLSVVVGSDTPNWMIGSSNGTVQSTAATFNPGTLTTGNNYIYLAVIDAQNCKSAADSINYYLADLSALTAGSDFNICIGSEVQLMASGGVTYSWIDNDDLTELAIADPIAKVDGDDDYIVTITDVLGCQLVDTVHVTLLPLDSCFVETFNTFSPNGDGKNDFWIIDGIEGYTQNTVTIFNRWGDIMIRFENYDNSTVRWDGYTSNEKLVTAGTYYYVVDVNGTQSQSGWVQIMH